MHQYIMQLHIILLKQKMAASQTWISRIKALIEFFLLQKFTPLLHTKMGISSLWIQVCAWKPLPLSTHNWIPTKTLLFPLYFELNLSISLTLLKKRKLNGRGKWPSIVIYLTVSSPFSFLLRWLVTRLLRRRIRRKASPIGVLPIETHEMRGKCSERLC